VDKETKKGNKEKKGIEEKDGGWSFHKNKVASNLNMKYHKL